MDEMDKSLLHMVPVHLIPSQSHHPGDQPAYRLQIPGIREDSPKLANGDILVLRGLFPGYKSAAQLSLEVEVTGMVKIGGWVYVRSPALAQIHASLPGVEPVVQQFVSESIERAADQGKEKVRMYRVEFKASAGPVCAMQDAVSDFLSLSQCPSDPIQGP
jgi:cytochrome oxidase assembly protein ShyY1